MSLPSFDGTKIFPSYAATPRLRTTTTELIASRFVDFVIDLRIVAPEFLARTSVESESDAPVRDGVDHAIDNERRRFLLSAARSNLVRPGQFKPPDIGRIDLFERAVSLLGVVEADHRPFAIPAGVSESSIINSLRLECHDTPGHE
jgi:hypothetical protein